jgi:acyl carrier protein
MDPRAIQAIVMAELKRIAPEIEEAALDARGPLRDQVDLDSMDWLNFLVALHKHLQVEIPESDYRSLGTLDQLVDYLARKLG